MATARVFMTGRSQAVRLPKEYRFACDEVEISKQGDALVLRPVKRSAWVNLMAAMEELNLLQKSTTPADIFIVLFDNSLLATTTLLFGCRTLLTSLFVSFRCCDHCLLIGKFWILLLPRQIHFSYMVIPQAH